MTDTTELRAVVAKMTAGEWETTSEKPHDIDALWHWVAPKSWLTRVCRVAEYTGEEGEQAANAHGIVYLKNNALTLADDNDRLRAELAAANDERARLRQHIADEANTVNIAGSAYDRAQAALDEIVAGVKKRARAALTETTNAG